MHADAGVQGFCGKRYNMAPDDIRENL